MPQTRHRNEGDNNNSSARVDGRRSAVITSANSRRQLAQQPAAQGPRRNSSYC
jgi:hypothetical protein